MENDVISYNEQYVFVFHVDGKIYVVIRDSEIGELLTKAPSEMREALLRAYTIGVRDGYEEYADEL